jgi:hypothetical protein
MELLSSVDGERVYAVPSDVCKMTWLEGKKFLPKILKMPPGSTPQS